MSAGAGGNPWRRVPGAATGAAHRRPSQPALPSATGTDPGSQATPTRPGVHIVRPIPDAGESFDAIAMKSVLSRARDTARFQAPEIEPDQTARRPFPLRTVLLVLGAVAVIGVVAGLVYVTFLRGERTDPETIVHVTATEEQEHLATPQEAVRGYLTALSDGDISRALAFGPMGGSGAVALVQPEAYAKMPAASRPTNIELLTDDPRASEVKVRYLLAGKQVETAIRVVRQDSGAYRLARTTVTIQFEVPGGDNLPMYVNDLEVDPKLPMEVVPGTYRLSTNLPYLAYPSSASPEIQSLAYDELTPFAATPELTAEGRGVLLRRAQQSLERCVASLELAPTGCPNAIRAPRPVVAGSVKWSVRNDPWRDFNPLLTQQDATVATTAIGVEFRVSMDYQNGSSSGDNDLAATHTITATMSGQKESDVQVVWSR